MLTLHYILDPLCGWCYAAAPLLRAARGVPRVRVRWHAGGMLAGPRRLRVTPAWREHVRKADARITLMTGQPFGPAYQDLLGTDGLVLDSGPPTAAMLAAEALADRGLDMLVALQQAYFVRGQPIGEQGVLETLARELGLDGAAYAQAYQHAQAHVLEPHTLATHALMRSLGAAGFPTVALETPTLRRVDLAPWFGHPDTLAQALQDLVEKGMANA